MKLLLKNYFELRNLLRKKKQYKMSDYIRDVLFPNIGYEVRDMKHDAKIKLKK